MITKKENAIISAIELPRIPAYYPNDSHNIALYLKKNNYADEIHYLFLIVVLKAALYQKYSWEDSISMKKIINEKFFLPVDEEGNPDWEYMSEYMQNIMYEVKYSIENLNLI